MPRFTVTFEDGDKRLFDVKAGTSTAAIRIAAESTARGCGKDPEEISSVTANQGGIEIDREPKAAA